MPFVTNLCCGAAADTPAGGAYPDHLPMCLVLAGARYECSCGEHCRDDCDGAWVLPSGERLAEDEMRRRSAPDEADTPVTV